MKKVILMVAAIVLLAAPALADYSAGTTDVTRIKDYYDPNYGGGEFTLYNNGLDTNAYSVKTKDINTPANSFQTFCVETHEYIMPPYYGVEMDVSTTNVNEATGAVTGPGSHSIAGGNWDKNGVPLGDNLDARTAYLYTKFATGTLTGYDYTPGPKRQASAADLQKAIWFIENETGGVNNGFVALANDATTVGGETDEWVGRGIGNVRVLNLYTESTRVERQDQLYLIPAPAAIGLGILGLGLVGWYMRRFA